MARRKEKAEFRTEPLTPEELAKFNILKKLGGKELARRMPAWARTPHPPRAAEFIPGQPAQVPSWTKKQTMAPQEFNFPDPRKEWTKDEYIAAFNRLNTLKNPRATAITSTGDAVAAHELFLFIVNDADFYRQQGFPIIQNLRRKVKRGIYKPDLALKLWRYLADSGAKKYTFQHDTGGRAQFWQQTKGYGIFTVPIREAAARELAAHYESEVMRKNPDVHIDIGSHNVKDGKYKWSEGIRNPRKRRRSAAQHAATRKLLAFNRARRGGATRRRLRRAVKRGVFSGLPIKLQEHRKGKWLTVAGFQGTPRGIKRAKAYARKYANFERVQVRLIRA